MQQLHSAKGYLVDLDGTLISGGAALPFAASLLGSLGDRFVLLSNDAEHMPEQLSRFLRTLNLHVPPQRIVLAGATAVDLVARELPGAKVMLLASTVLRTYARRIGIELVDTRADVVVLGRDRQFNFARLAAAANAVREGAELIVANPDRTHPGKEGTIVPETGALLSSILACTGDVPYRIIGKPETPMFWRALRLLGTEAGDTVMIGDNPETDGRGAAQAGMAFVHVDDWVLQARQVQEPEAGLAPAEI